MGCCSKRHLLSHEDRVVLSCERKLAITATPAEIENVFKKWAADHGLNEARFKKAVYSLGIGFGDNVLMIFQNFKNSESYDLAQVICFCVFLTQARPDHKATVWFDVLDVQVKNQLTYGQVKEFIQMIFQFTFQVLPKLAASELSAETLELYQNQTMKSMKSFVDMYSLKVCPEHTLDKEIFEDQLQIFSKLTYSEGVRSLLHEIEKN